MSSRECQFLPKLQAGISASAKRRFWHLFEVDARPIFAPYFQGTMINTSTASPQAFELVVGSWLSDLVGEREASAGPATQGSWLIESGLLEAVVGGQIEYATAE